MPAIAKLLEPHAPGAVKLTARALMTPEPFTVTDESLVVDAARMMQARGVSNAPVIRTDFTRKMLVGFISEKDVMLGYASGRLYSQPDLQVGEIMRTHPMRKVPDLAGIFTPRYLLG